MLVTTGPHCLYKYPCKMLCQQKIILLDTASTQNHLLLDRFEGTKDHIICIQKVQNN